MDPIDACEMIHKVNTVYQLKTFQLLCEHTIVHNINSRSVIPILGVTYIKGFDNKVGDSKGDAKKNYFVHNLFFLLPASHSSVAQTSAFLHHCKLWNGRSLYACFYASGDSH